VAGSSDEDAFVGQGWHPVGIVCLVLFRQDAKGVTAGAGWVGFTGVTGR
jgi:hypothetical protein